ncbi:tetratricopeptide repeat protein [Psychroserpens sp. AS72]|uniref:tetratricopeptide repeat protein n=1 Tax=Psychroserpens sp. AS72 TaxID=3135775 RepID=UPI0031735EEC
MPYYLIIALQVFCIYHLYKNKNDYYWFFLIIFLPAIGCIIYLITQVYNKRDVNKIQEELTTIINPSKKVRDLEKTLEFSETFQNRVNLADAFLEIKDFKTAISHYETAIAKDFHNDTYVLFQLIKCYYFIQNYDKVIFYAEKVKDHTDFKGSKAQFYYGLSLENLGQSKEAEKQLKFIDQRYSNYAERLQIAQLYINKNKGEEAKELLNEISIESQHMTTINRKKYRATIREVERLLKTL